MSLNRSANFTEESTVQKAYTIGGVPIIFPYKAYPSQITMMDKIVKCLNKKANCLLESPTGSGKSLALLCASLAWVKKTTKEINEAEERLTKHLNAHGVAVADPHADKFKSHFEKFMYSKHNKPKCNSILEYCKPANEKELSVTDNLLESASLDRNNKNDASESNPSNHIIDEGRDSEMKIKSVPHDCNQMKKRGITYIDDDDFKDFQPVKKNKIFSASTSEDANLSQCCNLPAEDINIPTSSGVYNMLENSSSDSSHVSTPKIPNEENNLPSKIPKIYFGTRTHKQIAQIIRELKKTPYKDVKMTILSSRERTCIHPKNCKSQNKNEGCDELINREGGPACNFYKNIKRLSYYQPMELSTAFDLEDLVSICRRKQVCPYFGAREMLSFSEIVFCPYNYLVDPLIRSALSISLKGNIIIMDEAHNIEDAAREAASSKVSVHQLQETIADVLQIGQFEQNDTESYIYIGKVLENLKNCLEKSENLTDYVTFDSSCKVWSGDEMIAFLDIVGLGPDTFPIFQSKYSKICRDESEAEKEKTVQVKVPKLSGGTHMCLKGLTETLNYMYKDKLVYVSDYRCVIIKSKTYSDDKSLVVRSYSKRMSFTKLDFEITLNIWCLNPAVAFSDMKNVHSIVVASGTLAPLTSFQSELGIPFQINLEANHVIHREQIWVGTIGKGPSNNSLNANYLNASTFAFQDDIGNLVSQICSVVPHGILCFLPSYGLLDRLVNRWQLTGLWDKLLCKKVVLCEPRRANEDFQQVIQDFYDAVKDSEMDNTGIHGALLFAVCRGKVSEGIDFADNYARAVITIGIPFPNVKDAQVDLKKKYNDMHSSKRQIVSGSAWYEMQAFRALNQALGRCIRHRNDFGALIIVDERFQKNDRYVASLSKWIKKEVRHYNTFPEALSSLSEFSDRMGLKNLTEIDL